MTEITQGIFGGYTPAYWVVALIFGLIGFVIHKLVTFKRSKTNTDPFSPIYWIRRNWLDVVLGFLLFFVWVRFKNDILDGFGTDPIIAWAKRFTDSFFIHFVFGMMSTEIARRLRKYFEPPK